MEANIERAQWLFRQHKYQETIDTCNQVLAIDSNSIDSIKLIAKALFAIRKFEDARLYLNQALNINPDDYEAIKDLGNTYQSVGEFNMAKDYYRKAIEINSSYAPALTNLGIIELSKGNNKNALSLQFKATEADPQLAPAHYNLGAILRDLGRLKEAELSTRKAIELKPDFAEAHNNLGAILKDLGKLEESKQALQRSIEIRPNENSYVSNLLYVLLTLYSWDEINNYLPFTKHLGLKGKGVNPLCFMYLEDNPESHLKRAIKYNLDNKREELENICFHNNNKIKIGYFSSDFSNHPVSISLTSILELHDKSKFKIYAYSLKKRKDEYTVRIKNAVSCFREVNDLSDIEIVNIARDDQIDIAIDLNGYSEFNRKSIFDYRVAPIQINYLGYPGTMGTKSYDFIIADEVLIPEENKKFYTEKVLYLPHSSIPYDSTKKISIKKFSREELGLPSDGFVFTCFNNIIKITPNEFKIWIRLLLKVEKSVLWITKPNNSAIKNILSEITNHGIDKNRVIFAERMKLDDHLSRHSCADLFLDTFNFNAATTANIALSSGLPIITLIGKSYSARMTSSILTSYNLNELITNNYLEYEQLAYELATDKEKYSYIYEKINSKLDPSLFNSFEFTQNLEEIYTYLSKD